jgi:hypothetical protein
MLQTLQTLLLLRSEGTLAQFAIGGAVAASFYAPAVATEDLDVFAFLKPSDSGLLILTPLYERLKELGGEVANEFVILHGWPVQILPAYTPLVEEAVIQAQEQRFESIKIPVVDADYLCAIALQTGRSKDYQRVHSLIEANAVNTHKLHQLVEKFQLGERWTIYARRYS